MSSPIVDLRNIDLTIWRADDGALMCRVVTRSPTGKMKPVEFEVDESTKLFQALAIIGETARILDGEAV